MMKTVFKKLYRRLFVREYRYWSKTYHGDRYNINDEYYKDLHENPNTEPLLIGLSKGFSSYENKNPMIMIVTFRSRIY